jgi:hypothetical protein
MTGGVSRAQASRQQASGVALEDQHRMIHVLAVSAVEEAELLLAVGRIVGGIEIEQDLAPLADLLAAEADELLPQGIVQAHQIVGRRRVLPAAESGLGSERVSQWLIGDDLQEGIVAQPVGVVGVFVSGDDLVEALPQQRQRVVLNAIAVPRIAEQLGQITGQTMALIKSPQGQKTGITGDLTARKIGADRLIPVEEEAELWSTISHFTHPPISGQHSDSLKLR